MFRRVADTADFINAIIIALILLFVASVFGGALIGFTIISVFSITKAYEQVTFASSVVFTAVAIITALLYSMRKEFKEDKKLNKV